MTEETVTEETNVPYWHFSTDPQGVWLAEDGTRMSAHAAVYWVTPQGFNVGCPQAATEERAGAAAGYRYAPLIPENPMQV